MSNYAQDSAPSRADHSSSEVSASKESEQAKSKREYRPHTKTIGRAFINALVRQDRDEEEPLYFVKVGLLTGREATVENGERSYRDRVQFLDLLVGSALKRFVEEQFAASGLDVDEHVRIVLDRHSDGFALDGVLFNVEIHDVHFSAHVSDREPVRAFVNNNGVLAGIALGFSEGV